MGIEWKAIVGSDAWEFHIEPWLKEFHQDALYTLQDCEAKDFKYRQGYARAVLDILNLPAEMIEAERQMIAQENRENGERDANRRDWLRAVRRAVGR